MHFVFVYNLVFVATKWIIHNCNHISKSSLQLNPKQMLVCYKDHVISSYQLFVYKRAEQNKQACQLCNAYCGKNSLLLEK